MIDQIEVMMIIDVNIGLYVGGCFLEDIVFKINMEVIQVIVC